MNKGTLDAFIARMDEMIVLLEEIKLNTAPTMRPVKAKKGGTSNTRPKSRPGHGSGQKNASSPRK